MAGPRERLRENVTSATALMTIGLGILALAAGFPYFWVIFVIGLLVVVPLVGLLFGAEDWRKWDPLSDEFWEDISGEADESRIEDVEQGDGDIPDPLETLRDRYARGELSEAQFERKLELLLETETIEDVEDRYGDREAATDRE